MSEIWKGVIYQGVDYSWRLEVSNLGQLRNMKTKHIYKTCLTKGYYNAHISIKGIQKHFMIHRCVAETFIKNTYDKNMVVNHKNGVKTDNFVENLEFVTQSENTLHAFKTGLLKHCCGVECNYSKLSISDIEFIIKNYKSRDKEFGINALATKYSVSRSTISRIINGETYVNEVSHIKSKI